MPSVVIKPDRHRDEYVVWSTVTESPHAYGNRAEMVELLRGGIRGPGDDVEGALSRADLDGSSAMGGWASGHWDQETWIYKQAGLLPRDCLWRAAELQCAGRESEIYDLLDPLEDTEDERRRLARRKAEAGPGAGDPAAGQRVADAEVGLARAAIGQVAALVKEMNR